MTIQVTTTQHSTSKAVLEQALNETPGLVWFKEPTPFGDRSFTGGSIAPDDRFPVVMDPQTRRRFAVVVRKPDGSFRVR